MRRAVVGAATVALAVLALGASGGQATEVGDAPRNPAALRDAVSRGETVRTSVANDGQQAADGVSQSMISGDGRWQVFVSTDDLAEVANGGLRNVYVRDLVNKRTVQVSVTARGGAPNGNSSSPSISDDGSRVSFVTDATDITGDEPGALTLIVCDLAHPNANGAPTCHRVYSTDASSDDAIDTASAPRLAGDGTKITWLQHTTGTVAVPAAASTQVPATPAEIAAPSTSVKTDDACSERVAPGQTTCFAVRRTDLGIQSRKQVQASPAATPNGYGPADLASAYGLPSASGGLGQRVYIADPYDDPDAESDLGRYRAQYGLPACTTANGCFQKLNQDGEPSPLPAQQPSGSADDWALEMSVTLDTVSAVCPNCAITLIEADDSSLDNQLAGVKTATDLGAKFVVIPWGAAPETGSEPDYDRSYLEPSGVVYAAAAGIKKFGVRYPATSPRVIAVGGTSLTTASNPRGWDQTVWADTGSGCSSYEAKPSWQSIVPDGACSNRADVDVAAVADPATGVAVYQQAKGGWAVYGGTSVSASIIAAAYALAGTPAATDQPAADLYARRGELYDVTTGNNGTCSPSVLCTAGPGWDGPTGLGTPAGTAALVTPPVIRVANLDLSGNGPTATALQTVTGNLPDGTVYRQPVLDRHGDNVVYVASTPGSDGTTIRLMETSLGSDNTSGASRRLDVDPDNPGACVLGGGERGCLGDPYVTINDVEYLRAGGGIDDASISSDGTKIAFRFWWAAVPELNFRDPGADPAEPTGSWELVATVNGSDVTSQVVSVDNDGKRVDGEGGAISGDGRFVAFLTDAPNASDGQVSGGRSQLVMRDLVQDAQRAADGQPPLPGALVSRTHGCADPDGCAAGARTDQVSLDYLGSRASFISAAGDLVEGDDNNSDDAFVRTWTPTVRVSATSFGSVDEGATAQQSVPVTVTGFGPAVFGSPVLDPSDGEVLRVDHSNCAATRPFGVPWYGGIHYANEPNPCSVRLAFTPIAAVTSTAKLIIPFAAALDLPAAASVTVTGTGTPTGPLVAPGDTVRTSLSDGGAQAPDGGYDSMISGNGRWDVFVSESDLTGRQQGDEPVANVFVRDLAHPRRTVQISLHDRLGRSPSQPSRPVATRGSPTGTSPNASSLLPSISADGRFVSFITYATDVVPLLFPDGRDPYYYGSWTVVVCDRDPTGKGLDRVQPGTRLPNYVCYPVESGDSFGIGAIGSVTPRLSADGTHITWEESGATDGGQRAMITRLSAAPDAALQPPFQRRYVPIFGVAGFPAGDRPSTRDALQSQPIPTADGHAVVFLAETCCSEDPSSAVIETDLDEGTSIRVDQAADGDGYLGDEGFPDSPACSYDGTRVAFSFRMSGSPDEQVYVATIDGDAVSTSIASRDNHGEASSGSEPALSGDGRYLAFATYAPNMHDAIDWPPGTDSYGTSEIVARDLVRDEQDATARMPWRPSEIVSASLAKKCLPQVPAGRTCAADANSENPSVDATGSEVGFDSLADDLVRGDTNVSCSSISSSSYSCLQVDAFVHTWRPTLAAADLDFGSVSVGVQADKTLTVTEQAVGVDHVFGPISPGGTPISGPAGGDYTVAASTCSGATLEPGDSCTISARFAPSAAGVRSATIAVNTGANGFPRNDPHLRAGLTGDGIEALLGRITAEPTTLDFGKQLPLAPASTKTVTLTNSGTGSVAITDVSVHDTGHPGASADYSVDTGGCPASLPAGESCALTVAFVGQAVGSRDAELVVTDDSGAGPTTVALAARVPKPTITANPGVSPPGRATMISGTGFAPDRNVDVGLKGFGEHAVVRADNDGSFSVGLVIFRNTPEGPQVVTAHTHSADKSISARGPLLLAVGSVDILDLVTRH